MKTEKFILGSTKNVLSRAEMRNVKGGNFGGGACPSGEIVATCNLGGDGGGNGGGNICACFPGSPLPANCTPGC
ncbi:MAG: hypothetical protein JWQ66_1686 [Mucilaginibacter sp.]|nr:hypothetical protein [Mucilaginibacter sp.]